MTYSNLYGLQSGDRIIEPLFSTGILKHHAVYLGSTPEGVELIAENTKINGVHIIKASDYFLKVKKIDRIEKFKGTYTERKVIVQRALKLAGKPYSLLNYNCESFANDIIIGKAISKQADIAYLGIIALLILGLISND
ncbi:lecithin retinol acyltransferase family protein [Limnovirga soli]|uniref:LRAT domain-containing protein n=1 Tax=Limnovirga soli TaxID=2656915 RepID=A0A8J8FDG3_9BACT|nr:lecithin retinol acyltransferase family protein [Limnovirga soli]NNV53866.1 hypothetical protein [Limnovirga soli]